MTSTIISQNGIQNSLFKDFIKPTPVQRNITTPHLIQKTDNFERQNIGTKEQKSIFRRIYDYLLTPVENPDYKKGKIGASPTTTRLQKLFGYTILALTYGFMFYFLTKSLKGMKAAETTIVDASAKIKNAPAFMEQYKEDLARSSELKDLALPDVLKRTVGRLMNKINDPQSFIQKGGTNKNTILLYGPPGTGKTTVAKAIAKEIKNAELFSVDLSTVQDSLVGQSEANLDKIIRNICQYAKENAEKKIVVLMDEFDSIAIKDNGSSNQQYHASLLNVLKRAISEKLTQHDNIILIATTNAELNKTGATGWIQTLDSAIADRFGEQIRVDKPTKGQFIKAIANHYKNLAKVEDTLKNETSTQVAEIADKLSENECSFRTLENLFNNAAAESKGEKLTFKDILSALETCIKSTKNSEKNTRMIGFGQ